MTFGSFPPCGFRAQFKKLRKFEDEINDVADDVYNSLTIRNLLFTCLHTVTEQIEGIERCARSGRETSAKYFAYRNLSGFKYN